MPILVMEYLASLGKSYRKSVSVVPGDQAEGGLCQVDDMSLQELPILAL
jgi:hypothetical protein